MTKLFRGFLRVTNSAQNTMKAINIKYGKNQPQLLLDILPLLYNVYDKFHQNGKLTIGSLTLSKDEWEKVIIQWATKVNKSTFSLLGHEVRVGQNHCWLVGKNSSAWTLQRGEHSKKMLATRVLAFLQTPTERSYNDLISVATKDEKGEKNPFDHKCGRGDSNESLRCVNGIEHGTFASREVNEKRKLHKFTCLALCISNGGHGEYGNCIYTSSCGKLLPCLNNSDGFLISKCNHEPKCFQNILLEQTQTIISNANKRKAEDNE